MLETIIQDFAQQMEAQREALENVLSQTLDFNKLEQKLSSMVNHLCKLEVVDFPSNIANMTAVTIKESK